MCGRFIRSSPRAVIVDEFAVEHFVNVDFAPRYNIAPSQSVEAIINDGTELRLGPMKWGYTTSSEKHSKPAPINARAETVATKPAFRKAFRERRVRHLVRRLELPAFPLTCMPRSERRSTRPQMVSDSRIIL